MKDKCRKLGNHFWCPFPGEVTAEWGDRITNGNKREKEVLR